MKKKINYKFREGKQTCISIIIIIITTTRIITWWQPIFTFQYLYLRVCVSGSEEANTSVFGWKPFRRCAI